MCFGPAPPRASASHAPPQQAPAHNEGLLLGAGILLLLEAVVSVIVSVSDSVAEMLKPIRAPLFRAHELFALTLAKAASGSVPSAQEDIYIAALVILSVVTLSNLFISFPRDDDRAIFASRFLGFVASLLIMIDVFAMDEAFLLGNTQPLVRSLPVIAIAFLVAGESARSMYQDTEFGSQQMYATLVTLAAMTSYSYHYFIDEEPGDGYGSRAMQISGHTTLIFAVAMAYYQPAE